MRGAGSGWPSRRRLHGRNQTRHPRASDPASRPLSDPQCRHTLHWVIQESRIPTPPLWIPEKLWKPGWSWDLEERLPPNWVLPPGRGRARDTQHPFGLGTQNFQCSLQGLAEVSRVLSLVFFLFRCGGRGAGGQKGLLGDYESTGACKWGGVGILR